ncbi:MAG TPA: OmpA family protein [Burkholderiaceae bacterium]|nr:OmpA family protein [Burkholderiaceae bacterium]
MQSTADAQAPAPQSPRPGQVVASGTVPDEATKAAVLAKLRDVYGADRVVDQIAIGAVTAPANWSDYVQRLIAPNLKQVSRGQLEIDGNIVAIKGEVSNEATRQQIASDISTQLTQAYTVRNGLRVGASEQSVLDRVLANRIVEFESGSSTLTANGRGVLDEMAKAMLKLGQKKFEVIGHTDNIGARATNLSLSQARADAVVAYLAEKGVAAALMSASGAGADRPIADNATAEGRARNRRIEFRVVQ